jgi:hypothetical protein
MRNGMNVVFGSLAITLAVTFQAIGQFSEPVDEPAQDPAFQQPQADSQQQQTEAPPPAQVQPTPQRDVVATVNGDPIARSEFEQLVQTAIRARQQQQETQPELPPPSIQQLQQQVLDNLIEARLVEQHVREHGPDVEEHEVDAELNNIRQSLKGQGVSLEQYLAATKTPLEELRRRIEGSLAWQRFQKQQMSPDKLQEFYEHQKPRFGEATFEQVQPQVVQLYIAKIWEDIVKQMKPQAQIQMAQPQPNTRGEPVPQPQAPRP